MSDARDRILRKKKIEEAMEAAFDDDLYIVEKAVEDATLPIPVDPKPPANKDAPVTKEDSLLGEAACGGAIQVMTYLLGKGADPDHVGKHSRTPLHRALNNEQVDAVPVLLEGGADPRLLLPQEKVADEETGELKTVFRPWEEDELRGLQCGQEIKDILKAWDISKTFKLQQLRSGASEKKSSEERKGAEEKQQLFKNEVEELEAKMAEAERAHREAIAIRENRIREYDHSKCGSGAGKCTAEPTAGNVDVLKQLEGLIHEAEETERKCNLKKEEIRGTLRKKRVGLRQQEALLDGGLRFSIDTTMHQIEDILAEGEQNKDDASAKAKPRITLIVDETGSGNVVKFLTYRPVLMLDLGHSQQMNNVELRGSLLSSIRYGRVLVLFIRDWDVEEALAEFSDNLDKIDQLLDGKVGDEGGTPFNQKGALFKALCGGDLSSLDTPVHLNKLIPDALEIERPEFHRKSFTSSEKSKFRFNILTEMPCPKQAVLDQHFSVRITGPIPK